MPVYLCLTLNVCHSFSLSYLLIISGQNVATEGRMSNRREGIRGPTLRNSSETQAAVEMTRKNASERSDSGASAGDRKYFCVTKRRRGPDFAYRRVPNQN